MPIISIKNLTPGMVLSKHIITSKGYLLLPKGTILNDCYIKKLMLFNINSVEIDSDILPYELTPDEMVYNQVVDSITEIMHQAINNEDIDEEVVNKTVCNVVDHILNDPTAFSQIISIRDKDNYTFIHSADVTIFSIVTGISLGLIREELIVLGTSAFLHDIGKCFVPDEILFKPDRLNIDEFEIVKKHTIDGYSIIKERTGLGNLIASIVLQHHEKWDGSGYPFGINGNDIHRYARIITISDIYDALTADRVYKRKVLPHEAAEYIIANSGLILDPDLVKSFIQNIVIYPIGAKVVLSTGEIGSIIDINKELPYRPKIRITDHLDESRIIEPYDLDLIKHINVFITNII